MQQAEDFRQETRALYGLVASLPLSVFNRPTQFKGWTVADVLQHLHFWNMMAHLQLSDPGALSSQLANMQASGRSMRAHEGERLGHLSIQALLVEWLSWSEATADLFAAADPKTRLRWAGPDMSARSSMTARQMETWAHGQEIFDLAGVVRVNDDRIRNIVTLGFNTFGWTYATRHEAPPGPIPFLQLTAPSGEVWTYGDAASGDRIEGKAEEFCQVVTQTRNIADTALRVSGAVAADWMSKAQCFAGPPSPPPLPGTRFTMTRAES